MVSHGSDMESFNKCPQCGLISSRS
jgi:hypothetical protein